jgi:MFS family permease
MGVDAIAALVFGHLFDKKGILSLAISTAISIAITPVFFLNDGTFGVVFGIFLWGISMGAQESILKAVIATLVEKDKRATAYGIFYSVFGASWFIGSLIIGALYEKNILAVVLFTSIAEFIGLIALIAYSRIKRTAR